MDRLTEEEYGAWRQDPATKKIREYWAAARQSLMERWAAGEKLTDAQQAYAQILGDLEALTFQDIEAFYTSQEEETDDGSEGEVKA